MEKVHKFIAKDLSFRASIVVGTQAVREMQAIQRAGPLATLAVGRAMMAASMMASQLKNDQMVSIYFRGNGPLEMVFAEANYEGEVRGYTPQPQAVANSVGEGLGIGLMSVVNSHPQQATPHRGTVEIKTGEIGDDVAYYLYQSMQTRSIVTLGVKLNQQGGAESAGGILVEVMPGPAEEVIKKLEENFKNRASISEIIADGGSVQDIVNSYFKDLPVEEMPHDHELIYKCRCTREKLGNALALLGPHEVQQMIDKGESAKARCEFCGRHYEIEVSELEILLEKLKTPSTH